MEAHCAGMSEKEREDAGRELSVIMKKGLQDISEAVQEIKLAIENLSLSVHCRTWLKKVSNACNEPKIPSTSPSEAVRTSFA